MGDETNGGAIGISGDRAIDIAMLVHKSVLNTKRFHLLHKIGTENLLLLGRGAGLGKLVGFGIKGYIFQKPFLYCCHRFTPFGK